VLIKKEMSRVNFGLHSFHSASEKILMRENEWHLAIYFGKIVSLTCRLKQLRFIILLMRTSVIIIDVLDTVM
jgi:hypothetical protein